MLQCRTVYRQVTATFIHRDNRKKIVAFRIDDFAHSAAIQF